MAVVELGREGVESGGLVEPPARAEAAAPPTEREPVDAEARAVARGFVVGSMTGAVIVFLVSLAITVQAGFSVGAAVSIGAFAAAWGGPGFGGMLGAVTGYQKYHP